MDCTTFSILGANVASVVLSTCVASRVLGTCLVSGIPSTMWPPVQQKFFAKVLGRDMELREGGGVKLGSFGWTLMCVS